MTTPFGRQYLNMYLNQANPFAMSGMSSFGINSGFGCSSDYYVGSSLAQFGVGIASIFTEAVICRMFESKNAGGYYGGGGGSSYNTEVQELETKKANAEAEVDKKQPRLSQAVKLWSNAVTEYQTYETYVTNLTSNLKTAEGELQTIDQDTTLTEEQKTAKKQAKQAEIDKLNEQIREYKAKMAKYGTSLDDVKSKLTEAEETRQKAIDDYISEIDDEIEEIEKEKDGNSAELKSYNSAQKLLSPKRKAIGDFSSAAKKFEFAMQPGKTLQSAKDAANALMTAYANIQNIESNKDGIADGISSSLRYYTTHRDAINNPQNYVECDDNGIIKSVKEY